MEETAYAKINLALHVRGREADGYHRIETLFAFAEDGDLLRAEPADALTLALEGPFAADLEAKGDNLVVRAARALQARFEVASGARLTLLKNVPIASGIGGGSADAAAALRLLNRLWALGASEAELLPLARDLGADVPACLLSRTAVGEGRGDRLTEVEVPGLAGAPLLLVNPGVPVSTAEVFRRWDDRDGGPLPPDWTATRNDLEAPTRGLAPEIEEVLGALCGARIARMSGSGATCFAVYDSLGERDEAAAALAAARPGWWLLVSRFR